MKRQNSLLILTMSALLAPTLAHAEDNRQVWRDSEDQIVHNTFGNCVRSIWTIDHDPCAVPAPVVATYTPPPPPPPRTIIAEADRTVYFPFNKADLTEDARARLNSLAQRISSANDVQGAQVVGYADRIGTTSYNEALSQKRAQNVSGYLVNHGVVNSSVAQTRWVGKSESNTQCPPNLTHDQLVQCLAPDRKVTVELQYKEQAQTQPQTNAAPMSEQNPQDWTGQAPPQPQPKQQSSQQNPPDWEQYSTTQMVQPQAGQPALPIAPQSMPPAPPPSVQTFPLQQSSADPQPQSNSDSPAAYTSQAPSPVAQQYAEAHEPPQPSDQDRMRYLTTGE